MVDATLAGACGLYCGACAIYRMAQDRDIERLTRAARNTFHCEPDEIRCGGCRGPVDSLWSPDCEIKTCTQERGLDFCHECADFPCPKLVTFSADRRDIPITNLRRMAEIQLKAWLTEQAARWRCPVCGRAVDIYSQTCRACGAELPA